MMPTAKIVITQGRDGCLAYAAGAAPHQVPALADKVVDTVGAGDAFLAITHRWWRPAAICGKSALSVISPVR